MASDPNRRSNWSMQVVLVCQATPPPRLLRETVDEVCGEGCLVDSSDERPVIRVEADAPDAAQAVAALNAKAQQLVNRLSRFDCAIESTGRLEDLSEYPAPQGGSLGEGARDR